MGLIGCLPFSRNDRTSAGIPDNRAQHMPLDCHDDVVLEAIGEATMCWEHVDRAGVFKTEEAIAIGDRLTVYFADHIADFKTARQRVCDDMAKDADLHHTYHANIAMTIFDNSCLNIESCNRLADAIMQHIFT